MRIYLIVFLIYFQNIACADCTPPAYPNSDLVHQGFVLSDPLLIEEVEAKNIAPGDSAAKSLIPFGAANKRWLELKQKLRDTDTIHKATKVGFGEMYIVVRDSCVIDGLRTVVTD